jgi:hypothetical protein
MACLIGMLPAARFRDTKKTRPVRATAESGTRLSRETSPSRLGPARVSGPRSRHDPRRAPLVRRGHRVSRDETHSCRESEVSSARLASSRLRPWTPVTDFHGTPGIGDWNVPLPVSGGEISASPGSFRNRAQPCRGAGAGRRWASALFGGGRPLKRRRSCATRERKREQPRW